MTASALIPILEAVLAVAQDSVSCRVTDGVDTSGNTSDVMMIGVDDPASYDNPVIGSSDQVVATLGSTRTRDETGTITCSVVASTGNDLPAARAAISTYVGELEAALRADPQVGLAGYRRLVVEFGGINSLYQSALNDAAVVAIFSVTYIARL